MMIRPASDTIWPNRTASSSRIFKSMADPNKVSVGPGVAAGWAYPLQDRAVRRAKHPGSAAGAAMRKSGTGLAGAGLDN
jgi:hypothetical protein